MTLKQNFKTGYWTMDDAKQQMTAIFFHFFKANTSYAFTLSRPTNAIDVELLTFPSPRISHTEFLTTLCIVKL